MQWLAGSKGHLWLVCYRIISHLWGEWKEVGAGPTQAGKGDKSDQSCIRPASHQAPHTNGHYRYTSWPIWTLERNNLRGAIENQKAYP